MAQNGRMITLATVWFIIVFEFSIFCTLFLNQLRINVLVLLFKGSSLFWIIVFPFVFFSIMVFICYYKAITTQPGSPNHLVVLIITNLESNIRKFRLNQKEIRLRGRIKKINKKIKNSWYATSIIVFILIMK